MLRVCRGGAAVALDCYPCECDETELAKLVEEIRAKGGVIERYAADVSDKEAVNDMVQAIIKRFGRADMLVNNAVTGVLSPFTELSFETFMHMMKVNCGGAFLMRNECIPQVLEQGSGSIVMVSFSL
ncbi:MAG: SDR family NAD(P)-dependent oxidoreductase [Oscillospiraceae bacterium]